MRRVAVLALMVVLSAAACGEARTTVRPSQSLLNVEFTPRDSPTIPVETADSTDEPTFVSIPVGWDNAFCGIVTDAVDAQELVIDVESALEDEDFKGARGLARDLRDVTEDASALLADLPDWDEAADAVLELATLVDLGTRAGAEYGTYFAEPDQNRTALRRARELRNQIKRATPAANEALAALEGLGIVCDVPLHLETF
ncbi:MAG TPA: hypothetical protein VMZ33_03040 [Candidatus Limnocylindrales bacterium]|nr:hypothetical protein [Candidatus Limnocylindrales bacterium]